MSLDPAPPGPSSPSKQARKVRRQGPSNPPPVWAETRQELAESLPYYRAYQSGSYTVGPLIKSGDLLRRARKPASTDDSDGQVLKDYVPYAYLLGGYGSRRDAWAAGGRLVVSHGGGRASASSKAEKGPGPNDSTSSNSLKLSSSQSRRDPRIAALLSSYKNGTPIILILAENYPHADFELNCAFAVLGWYAITACWAELEDDMVRWKVRFEWLEQQGQPWWCSEGESFARPPWNPRRRIERVQIKEGKTKPVRRNKKSKSSKCSAKSVEKTVKSAKKSAKEDRGPFPGQAGERTKRTSSLHRSLEKILKERERRGDRLLNDTGVTMKRFSCESWWSHFDSSASQICPRCDERSPQVYDFGWTCLQPECKRGFWRLPAGAREEGLRFARSFLEFKVSTKSIPIPFPIQPEAPQLQAGVKNANNLRGLFCKDCHRLSCREYLAFHRCAHCSYTIIEEALPIAAPLMPSAEQVLLQDAFTNPRFDIQVSRRIEGPLEVLTFILPDAFLGSKIHVVQPYAGPDLSDAWRRVANQEADDIFAAIQRPIRKEAGCYPGLALGEKDDEDLWQDVVKLRRHELTMHRSCASGSKARLLTQMFTCNIGAPYKHSTATETQELEKAPQCIKAAGELITSRTALVADLEGKSFNELYPCGYIEGMQMNYHDDGEPGLGPIVSSLSLGNVAAKMNFRLKKKFAFDRKAPAARQRGQVEERSEDKDERILADGEREAQGDEGEEGTELEAAARTQPAGSQPEKTMTLLQRYKDLQLRAVRTLDIPAYDRLVLSIPLRHGAVAIQEGRALQECIEHAVVPDWEAEKSDGGMRFAITARRIDAA